MVLEILDWIHPLMDSVLDDFNIKMSCQLKCLVISY